MSIEQKDGPAEPNVKWKDGPAEPGPRVYTVKVLPLNVRVAQALGYETRLADLVWEQNYKYEWEGQTEDLWIQIIGYQHRWEVTGPLIQTHEIALRPLVDMDKVRWYAEQSQGLGMGLRAIADTPLEAVCEVLAQMEPEKEKI